MVNERRNDRFMNRPFQSYNDRRKKNAAADIEVSKTFTATLCTSCIHLMVCLAMSWSLRTIVLRPLGLDADFSPLRSRRSLASKKPKQNHTDYT